MSSDAGGISETGQSFGVSESSTSTRVAAGPTGISGLLQAAGASVLGAAVGLTSGDIGASEAASAAYAEHQSMTESSRQVNEDGSSQTESRVQTMGPNGLIEQQTRTTTSAPDENGVVHVSKEGTSVHPDGTVTSFVERASTLTDENGNSVTSSVRQDRTPDGITESRLSTLQAVENGVVSTLVQGTVTGPDGVTRDVNFAESHPFSREQAQSASSSEMGGSSSTTHGVGVSLGESTSSSVAFSTRAAYSEQVAATIDSMAATGLSKDQLESVQADRSESFVSRDAASSVLAQLDNGASLDQAYAQAGAGARELAAEFSALSTATGDMVGITGIHEGPAGLQSLSDQGLTRSDLMAIAADENAPSAQQDAANAVLNVLAVTNSAPEGAAEVGLQSARQEAGELAHALADASQTLRTKDGVTSEELQTLAQSPDLSNAQATAISMIAAEAANNGGSPQAVEAALDKAGQFAENLGALANSRVQVEELPALVAASSPDQALGGVTPADALQTLTQAHTQALAAELPSALEALADAKPDYNKLKELAQDSTAAPDQQLAAQTVLDQLPASAELTGVSPEQIQETVVALAAAEQQAEAGRVAGVIEALQFSEHVATADEAETSSKQAEQDAMSME